MVKPRSPSFATQAGGSASPPLASLSLASGTHFKPCKVPFINPLKGLHSELVTSSDSTVDGGFLDDLSSQDAEGNTYEILGGEHGHNCSPQADNRQAATPGEERETEDCDKGFTCARQRLQHHRNQVCGKVVIPDTWGREHHLQDWVSYGIVEDALRPAGLMSARSAMVSECQRDRNVEQVQTSSSISANLGVS